MPITLIPVNPADRDLMSLMTRKTSPRWMRIAACLAMWMQQIRENQQ